jgi:hypothetical protein
MADELTVIGRIPGYNDNIDSQVGSKQRFRDSLLKGITFVDMYPTGYTAYKQLAGSSGFSLENFFSKGLAELFSQPGIFVSTPSGKNKKNPMGNMYTGILTRLQETFKLSPDFVKTKALRIIAANDSTFTETFSNSFDDENIVSGVYKSTQSALSNVGMGKMTTGSILKGVKSMDSNELMNLIGNIHQGKGEHKLKDLLSGALTGMNIAAPTLWNGSNYSSTLTMFIKLISPTGSEDCIRRNILEPLMYLTAAASPITATGIVYGFPLMWQIHAHGITNFRIGAIAAMSIIRGSFETTFTQLLQPTVVDVRLTIVPLLQDFAVQTNQGSPSIYTDENASYLGVQNPGDIARGTMNGKPIGHGKTNVKIVSVKL